jgi:hypothetical protein
LPEGDPLRKTVSDFDQKVDAVRKKIVATTEGGAITGEERLREHTDQLYGALLSYEGKPGGYQIAYIDALKRELVDVTKEFEQLLAQDLPGLNESLKSKGQQPIPPPPAKVALNEAAHSSGGTFQRSIDPDASVTGAMLPANFRLH